MDVVIVHQHHPLLGARAGALRARHLRQQLARARDGAGGGGGGGGRRRRRPCRRLGLLLVRQLCAPGPCATTAAAPAPTTRASRAMQMRAATSFTNASASAISAPRPSRSAGRSAAARQCPRRAAAR